MMNIEQGISNYELDIKCSSSTRDFMAGAVTRPTACTQCGGLMQQFRHSGRREAAVRNLEKTMVYWIPDLAPRSGARPV